MQPVLGPRAGRDIGRMAVRRALLCVSDDSPVQLLLVGEVVVNRGDVRVRAATYLLDGRIAEAALGEHLTRGLEQPLARIARSCGGRRHAEYLARSQMSI